MKGTIQSLLNGPIKVFHTLTCEEVEGSVIGYLSMANRTFVAAEVNNHILPFTVFELLADGEFFHLGNFACRSDTFDVLHARAMRLLKL